MRSRIFAQVLARTKQQLVQITQNLFTTPHQSWLDTNGKPLAGGMLYAYEAGTSIPTNTWQDAVLSQLNTNPVVLDEGGFASIWLNPTQVYRFRMTNSTGVQQWTIDDYQGGSLTANILVPINYLLPATGTNSIDNGSNKQVWQWFLTGSTNEYGLAINEPAPSTNTSLLSTLFAVATQDGSSINPFEAIAHNTELSGPGLRILANGDIQAIGGANIISNITGISNQCVQADTTGRLFGTGLPCGAGVGGGIASINNSFYPAQTITGAGGITVTTDIASGVTTIAMGVAASVLDVLSLAPASVVGGSSSTGTAHLSGPAPTGGATVTLTSSNTAVAQVPASIVVAAGTTSLTFSVTTVAVTTNTPVSISGNYGLTQSAILTVTAVVVTLTSLSLNPSIVVGGDSSTGTVTLSGPALAAGAVVTLSSGNTALVQVPASVTVPAGMTTATFTVTTSPIPGPGSTGINISGTYGATQTGLIELTPPPQPIWGGEGQPGATSSVTVSGTDVILSTGDTLLGLQGTAEQIGESWTFNTNNQCVYLLLVGGTHTFVDANGNTFVFNLPISCNVGGVPMWLYQSTYQLFGFYLVRVAS